MSLFVLACTPSNSSSTQVVTITAETDLITRVNVLTAEEGKQEEVIEILKDGLNNEMSHQPGFVSATIHRSLDSENITVYAQWSSQQDFDAAVQHRSSGGAPTMNKVFSIAQPDSHPYSVVSIHKPKS